MKRLFVFLAYIVIFSQLFSIWMPFLDSMFMGYTIRYLIFYFYVFISISVYICKCLFNKTIRYTDFYLLIFIIGPLIVGILNRWGLLNVLVESTLFLMPISLYVTVKCWGMSKEYYTKIFSALVIIGAVISVLVATKVIHTSIWAPEGQLVRAAGAVDSTLFIGGYIFSFVILFVFVEKRTIMSTVYYVVTFISSIIGLLFSESRTRIIMILFITIVILMYNFYASGALRNIKFLLLVFISFLVLCLYKSDVLFQMINQVLDRFSIVTATDGNVLYRQTEINEQLKNFLSSPLFGQGWGSRSQYRAMYAHNMYSTLLMQGGILFFACFLRWIYSFVVDEIRQIKKFGISKDDFICIMFLSSILILGFTNAGLIQSGGYFMMLFVFIHNNSLRKKA